MVEDQQKKTFPSPPTTSSSTPPSSLKPSAQTGGRALSRRAFLIGAVGASTLLTAAAFAQSALPPDFGILGPLIPSPEPPTVIAKVSDLESKYQAAVATGTLSTAFNNPNTNFSSFFSWPYDISVSPYYKNIMVRLPDDKYIQQPTTDSYNGGTYNSSIYQAPGSPTGARFVAFNTTCVHLRCLVNPGYASSQFRLQCPCHGSQYSLTDGVPVQGPAYDLGLNPLPKVELSIDSSGNITATNLSGQPGIGRTTQ